MGICVWSTRRTFVRSGTNVEQELLAQNVSKLTLKVLRRVEVNHSSAGSARLDTR